MTFDLFRVWSNLCPSCCGNTGRLLHGICKCAGERLAHGPLVIRFRLTHSCRVRISEFNANSVDHDRTPHSAASDLGLHFLLMPHLWDAALELVGEVDSGH